VDHAVQMLWIGSYDSDEEFIVKSEKGMKTASAQVSQKNLVEGIEAETQKPMDSINGSIVPHFPVYRDRFVSRIYWDRANGARNVSVGYWNIKYLNRLTCRISMEREADHWVKTRYLGGELIILAYGLRSAPMATALRIKRQIPHARIFNIVTDLPEFMDLGESRVKKLLKKVDMLSIRRFMKRMEGYVLYAPKMAEYLSIPDGKWMLMEGSCDVREMLPDTKGSRSGKKAIMYSGVLDAQYGIALLMKAFMQLKNPDAELWLTGGGNAEGLIRECAEKDPRIRFFGFLPARADVLKLQAEAALMINMRLPSEPASAYCFPSKIFEYLCSGNPVLSYRLEGISEEYADYLIFIEDETAEATCRAMEKALAMDEEQRRAFGEAAREFVRARKSNRYQARRVLEFCQYNHEKKETGVR